MDWRDFFLKQNIWGKLIGAILGYMAARSIGALLGILIGNIFDKGLYEHYSKPYWHFRNTKATTVQKIFFETVFTIIAYIAKADGRVTQKSIDLAKKLMQDMELSKEEIALAKSKFNLGKTIGFNPVDDIKKLQESIKNSPALMQLFLDIIYNTAQKDGLTFAKQERLNNILRQLGYAPIQEQHRFYENFTYTGSYTNSNSSRNYNNSNTYNKQSSNTINSLEHAYAVLGIPQNSTQQEVKRAYRKMISKNHPDKLIAQGLPEALIKVANEKTKAICKAYELICAHLGSRG